MATNLFKPYRTVESKVSSLPIVAGQIIYCTDTLNIYLDTSSTTRVKYECKHTPTVTVGTTAPTTMEIGDIHFISE